MESQNSQNPNLNSEKENVYPAKPEGRSGVIPAQAGIQAPIALLILLLTFVVLGLGIFLGKTFFSSAKQNSGILTTPTVSVVSTTTEATSGAEMANWKTYKNEKYGFEFKYPQSWLEVVCPSNLYKADLCFQSPNYLMDNRQIPTSGGLLLIETQKKGLEIVGNNNFCRASNDSLYVCEKFNFNNISGWKRRYGVYETDAGILKDDKIVSGLRIRYPYVNEETEMKTIFDQILSTFKFTEKNPEGQSCGGIAANLPENQCPNGYHCQLDGNYPDAGGKCVK